MTGRFRPEQMELGEVPSEDIYVNPRSKDDVQKILRGIRPLVSNRKFRTALEKLLWPASFPARAAGRRVPAWTCGGYSFSGFSSRVSAAISIA